jgi:hypothetical protein
VQSLVDDLHLAGQRGAYRLTTRVETLPLPESVQGVLAARIDRLPEREKHVLQSASVIGQTFRECVLKRVVDVRGDGLGREQKTALDIVIMASWALPTAQLGLGDIAGARELADSAVELCRTQGARVALCRAHLARAAIARADPQAQSGPAEADLDAAEQLVAETGARALQPQVYEGRAALVAGAARERCLREAHRLYEEMGATGHAERVGRQLSVVNGRPKER